MTHESRLIGDDILKQEPYPTYCVLRRIDEVGRVAFSSYAVIDSPGFVEALNAPNNGKILYF